MTIKNYSKYHNQKTVYDGITFDSKAEAERYAELKLLQRAGIIYGLKRQVRFVIIPKRPPVKKRDTCYIADFVYTQDGRLVVEDVKGVETDVFKIKRDLMWTEHGIIVKVVKR